MFSPDSYIVHYNNGRSNRKHREGSSRAMMFADEPVMCAMTRGGIEEDL